MKRKFIAGEIACLKLEDGPEMIVEKIVENPRKTMFNVFGLKMINL